MLGKKLTHLGTQQVAWGATSWVRPEEWVALPTLTEGQERLVGLYRVNNAANQCVAFTVAGNYTVDWGDGSAPENVNSGVKAEHTYTFASLSAETETTEGWRQAIISITPQAGATLTSINLTSVHSVGTANYTSWWMDVAVVGAGLSACICGGGAGATLKPLSYMEQFVMVGTCSITNFTGMFHNTGLQSIVPPDTSAGTVFSHMFRGTPLTAPPEINTAKGLTTESMYDSSQVVTPPLIDTSASTDFYSMFRRCPRLLVVPAYNLSAGTRFTQMLLGVNTVTQIDAFGARYSISVRGNKLSHSELVKFLTNLGTAAAAGQVVDVSANPGTASLTPDDIAIATAKGWTVTT